MLTLHQIVPDSAAANVDQLLGRWVATSEKDSGEFTLSRRDSTTYLLGFPKGDSIGWYDAKFGRAGGNLILDLSHTDSAGLGPESDDLMLEAHMLLVVQSSKERLLVNSFDYSELRAALEDGRIQAPYTALKWETSVWWDSKSERTLLAVPKKIRGTKGDGDMVAVRLEFELL